jgi:hypothetical protein
MAFVANFTRSPSDDESELLIHWLQFPHQVADPSGSLKRATVILLPGYRLCKISR